MEGLEYSDHHKPHWSLRGQWLGDAHAADLLMMRVIRVAWDDGDIYELVAEMSEVLPLPEAVALAMHRRLDVKEKG